MLMLALSQKTSQLVGAQSRHLTRKSEARNQHRDQQPFRMTHVFLGTYHDAGIHGEIGDVAIEHEPIGHGVRVHGR